MNNEKMARRERLEAKGWKVVGVDEFLGLTPDESALVELKLNLSASLKPLRAAAQLSQAGLAERIHSSQSRVAKAEAGDPGVSLDLLVRAILATGASRGDLAALIAGDAAESRAASMAKGSPDSDAAFEDMLHDDPAHAASEGDVQASSAATVPAAVAL